MAKFACRSKPGRRARVSSGSTSGCPSARSMAAVSSVRNACAIIDVANGMTREEYMACDALGLRGLLSSRAFSAAEVEAAAREALERANRDVNGLADPLFDRPLKYAADGPLAGVPFLIKDIGPMAAGVPFYCGSQGVPGIRPDHDSNLMTKIRAAGLMTLGLTTMPEFGLNFVTESKRTGITRNPHDLSRNAGGSSGGS